MKSIQIKPSLFFMLHDYFVYDNIDYHAAKEPKENWNECIPYPGSLFIVGDPKQSIYRLSVTRGIVREVYKIEEWHESDRAGRSEFIGHIAEDEVRNLFINKKIPGKYRKKGMASSCLYCKY